MILKGSQRGGAKQLGAHLLRADENEHVEVHEVRGFASDDVMGAMQEAHAISQGTRCRQHLFSLSLNPPQSENVRVEVFDQVLAQVEERMGLTGQPRVVVFHEKEGRRHCHAVWSRINSETMTAIPLPFFKQRLRQVSKQAYLEHGWQMPRGLIDSKARDPRNFDLAEWQQAKRIGRDPRELKGIIQECWAASDSGRSFASALEQRGLYLAKGDRRGFVALTYEGEPLSIGRQVGKSAKEVKAKLGESSACRSIDETRAYVAGVIAPKLHGLLTEAKNARFRELTPLEDQRLTMKDQHARERSRLDEGQRLRSQAEGRARAERMRSGIMGLWDRVRGVADRIRKQNELEAFMALQRDREQRNGLIAAQLADRQRLEDQIRQTRQRHAARVLELHRDLTRQRHAQAQPQVQVQAHVEPPNALSEKFARMNQGMDARFEQLRQKAERGPPARRDRELER